MSSPRLSRGRSAAVSAASRAPPGPRGTGTELLLRLGKRCRGWDESGGGNNPPYLKGGAARAAARALPRGAQEGNEAASLHPLDLVLEALCHVVPIAAG